MTQTPKCDDFLLRWLGDPLTVSLALDTPRAGRAVLRTDAGGCWDDIPLEEVSPGVFRRTFTLNCIGVFAGKTCFFPEGSRIPEWPEGRNFRVKVESNETRRENAIYCVFPRQFGSFRAVVRQLPHIMDDMGFRIVQTLPPFPVPTSYAVMGEYGCPFAATDFYSVDPALAEFDEKATPLEQFRELIGAVHAKGGLFLVDLPANHTGWASALQTHHPEWFRFEPDGRFHSPGAWGVKWADLVELDYAHEGLRNYMAQVFLYWCRRGVDGFRCDAGYMIPAAAWQHIVKTVRAEYPDTIFLLEGLGGPIATTDALLADANLDWAYSEIFQTYDRGGFERYLPQAIGRSERYGTLVHFAETHDNDRLAKGGKVYARLRVQLAALLSWQGAWGIANGVEWYCTEKIDVHGKNDLNWGAADNMVALIAKLNAILRTHPSFTGPAHLAIVTEGDGNTLAVVREQSCDRVLVLANLDCKNETTIRWRRAAFPCDAARDLLTDRRVTLDGALRLGPGEVVCCVPLAESVSAGGVPLLGVAYPETLFHIVMPRDAKRDVVVPAGERVTCTADVPFRLRINEPETDRTLVVKRSHGANRVTFAAPAYVGDGTRCRTLQLVFTRYVGGAVVRTHSRLKVPPSSGAARMRTILNAEGVTGATLTRAALSNGAGAFAQVRAAWGEIASQYDAFLAANPNPTVPSDRVNVWARTRGWLQRSGYIQTFDASCETAFEADPAGRFARWRFSVPCGMGQHAAIAATLALTPGENAATLVFTRLAAGERDAEGHVHLVFRPDLECRSYHATTKAYQGAEALFARSVRATDAGCDFTPYGVTTALRVTNGVFHSGPEWKYNVAHPEEAARGQEGAGDLFSPGWITADLLVGERVTITCAYGDARVAPPDIPETCASTRPIDAAMREALDLYIVRRDDLKTVIAGYPWFLDWGRDTFIFLRGMIALGRLDETRQILQAFAAFAEKGTLPNIIYGKTAGNRDTTDAQLWFIRCVQEARADDLRPVCEALVDAYIAGTPNGIRVDAASGLVWSPSHFTWMDTNYPACTPRTGYPIEIQALWISALKYLGRDALAEQALASVKRLMKAPLGYYDCLAAPNGEPAERATPERTIRPNQLFLVTLDVLDDPEILRATEELLVPGAIRTVEASNALYRGTYAGDEDTSRKPAYHNGTAWCWPFPLYAEALVKLNLASRETALSLLASAVENLNTGCLAHLSEIADGDAPHAQKGCAAQAWSDSEFIRVWDKLQKK